jgi:HEAT repeat protein
MSGSIQISLALLLAVQVVPPAAAAEIVFEGKSLAEWKARTKPQFPLSERQDAVFALSSIAQKQMALSGSQPAQICWVETEIVPTMISLLHDQDTDIRCKAIDALGRFPKAGKSAAGPLIELLGDPDEHLRVDAARTLVAIAPSEAGRAVRVFEEVIHRSYSCRGYAAGAIAIIKPEGPKVLLALLDDENPDVRAAAIGTLRWSPHTTGLGLPELRTLLQDDSASVRRDAVFVVSQMRPPTKEAVSAILPLLHDRNARVRREVVVGLTALHADASQALPEMVKLASDDDDDVRFALAKSLAGMGSEAIPTLTELLDDKSTSVRVHAARSLGQMGPAARDAVPALKRHLTDMSEYGVNHVGMRVCHYAGRALTRILGDKSYLEGLPALPPDGK